ncbi:MAG: MAPEG family protein [Gammaproteobacteria bacterium]
MNTSNILLPVLALTGWTFIVLLMIPYRRFRAAFRQQVSEADFRYGESRRVPPDVGIPNRNMMNLLEMPVLFYVVCFAYQSSGAALAGFVQLAWIYVAARIVHSLIHLSYNRVLHRMFAFAVSNVVLILMWSRLFGALLQGTAT